MSTQARIDICTALSDLLNHKSFEDITVKDITLKSGYSRATFYRHFKDKYEVMNYAYTYKVDQLIDVYGENNQEIIIQTLEYMQNHSVYFKHVAKSEGQNSFTNFVYQYTIDYFNQYQSDALANYSNDNDEKSSLLVFISSGSVAIVNQWIKDNFKQPAKWIGQLIYRLLPDPIKPLN
ncbi:TetR/AcrR family transcriptional regulator [Fundicoccus culcitae]|uniref:TetR/AcrR family transcriptional regulator n=1 Tax=Fundicoccus culcitae TaxID=2969821 RepID=A0ABY5P411_9LACT|nr:TetR/AcrR family transcriptional regulator [Fundicoccus culcitae]UUX33316.1 TetR/AcrR family transcriptional regulator [Fundicoccus culcitae]